MPATPDDLRAILADQGFPQPERWLAYAKTNGLRREPATRLSHCPDCGGSQRAKIGQFVYYSHLASLFECLACHLLYTDVRLAPSVTLAHFEGTYKEETYFRIQRGPIFREVASWVVRTAPRGGSVLDIGGATGHLMEMVRARRPDLHITVSDISPAACAVAAEQFGFDTICSDIGGLADSGKTFDVVVMSDVIYLEPEVGKLWKAARVLPTGRGALIIRIPNKLFWMRKAERALQVLAPGRAEMADRIRFFNPEHLFVFSRPFLRRRLRDLGFTEVRCLPSRALRGRGRFDAGALALDALARVAYAASGGAALLSPSFLVVATHGPER